MIIIYNADKSFVSATLFHAPIYNKNLCTCHGYPHDVMIILVYNIFLLYDIPGGSLHTDW